jgi:hypothetical protein
MNHPKRQRSGLNDADTKLRFSLLLPEMHEMYPDKLIILAQFLAAVDDLFVSDNDNFRIFHEHAGMIPVATVEERRTEDLIRQFMYDFMTLRNLASYRTFDYNPDNFD